VIDPFLRSLSRQSCRRTLQFARDCDPIRRKLYRSFAHNPGPEERKQGRWKTRGPASLAQVSRRTLAATLSLSDDKPVVDYFKQFPGLDASPRFTTPVFWDLPIPVTRDIQVFRTT